MQYIILQLQTPFCEKWSSDRELGYGLVAPMFSEPMAPSICRFRQETRGMHSIDGLFFNTRPLMLHPLPDLLLIPFHGSPRRFLRTPSKQMEKATNMVNMIGYTEKRMDQLGNPWTRPQISRKSGGFCAFQKFLLESFQILRGKFGRSPRNQLCFNAFLSMSTISRFPSTNASAVNTKCFRYLDRLVSLVEKFYCSLTPLFQCLWASEGSHNPPPAQSIGHYLYRSQ